MVYHRRSRSSLSSKSWSSKSNTQRRPYRSKFRNIRSRSPLPVRRAPPPVKLPPRRKKPALLLNKRNTEKPYRPSKFFGANRNRDNLANTSKQIVVNRSIKCPFLLRVYYKLVKHHSLEDFNRYFYGTSSKIDTEQDTADLLQPSSDTIENLSSSELQLYTWMDTSLREIVDLVKDLCSPAWLRNSRFSLKLIHLDDKEKRITELDLGTLHNSRPGPEDKNILARYKFEIGDVISIAILPANPRPTNKRPNFSSKLESEVNEEIKDTQPAVEEEEEEEEEKRDQENSKEEQEDLKEHLKEEQQDLKEHLKEEQQEETLTDKKQLDSSSQDNDAMEIDETQI